MALRQRIAPIGLTLVMAGALAAQPAPATDVQLATFDAAWQIVWRTHFDTTFNGVDWKALRDEFRPRAVGASRDTVRRLITRMLDRLGQSHFSLIPGEAIDDDSAGRADGNGTAGLEVRLVEGRVVVTRVEPGGPAQAAGIRSGWIVTAVDGHRVDSLLERLKNRPGRGGLGFRAVQGVTAWLAGPADSAVRLALLDGSDRPIEKTLRRASDPSPAVKWGAFPTFFARFRSEEMNLEGVRVGVIWFNNWLVPLMRQVDSAIFSWREHDGIVLDLRGNTGGAAAMVSGLAGHFTPRRDTLGSNRTRTSTMYFIANPRAVTTEGSPVTPYAGPVAVLTDELSGSASEVFTGGMQALQRVRVFGDTSIGAVLPAIWDRLPNGDVLYHALGEFITVTGERLEGRGVLPHEPMTVTRADLLAGRDPVLEAAIRWIAARREPKNPGGDE